VKITHYRPHITRFTVFLAHFEWFSEFSSILFWQEVKALRDLWRFSLQEVWDLLISFAEISNHKSCKIHEMWKITHYRPYITRFTVFLAHFEWFSEFFSILFWQEVKALRDLWRFSLPEVWDLLSSFAEISNHKSCKIHEMWKITHYRHVSYVSGRFLVVLGDFR